MSKIFLFSGNMAVDPYPVYPLGMAVIASALATAGHEVRQFDLLAAGGSLGELRRQIERFQPDLVCLSLRNIDDVDSFSGKQCWFLEDTRSQVQVVRSATAAPIIVGGAGFSIMPEEILDYVGADFGVVGEGEQLVCALVDSILSGGHPPSISRSPEALVGSLMASPLLEPELVHYYVEKSGMVNLQSKRGCPHHCVYCIYNVLEGNTFRFRPAEQVIDDLQRITVDHRVDRLFFTDSIFNDCGGHYLSIAEEMIRRNLKVKWCAYFRPQGFGRKELAILKRAGLYAVEMGTDASSDTTLASLGKGFTFDDVMAANEACVAEKIPCAHFVIFGGPGETAETLEEGIRNMERLPRSVVFGFSGIRIHPGTPLHTMAIHEGVVADDDSLLQPTYYFSPTVDPLWMNERLTVAFRGRRDRIFPPSEAKARAEVMHRFGFKGILWDRIISFDGVGKTGRNP